MRRPSIILVTATTLVVLFMLRSEREETPGTTRDTSEETRASSSQAEAKGTSEDLSTERFSNPRDSEVPTLKSSRARRPLPALPAESPVEALWRARRDPSEENLLRLWNLYTLHLPRIWFILIKDAERGVQEKLCRMVVQDVYANDGYGEIAQFCSHTTAARDHDLLLIPYVVDSALDQLLGHPEAHYGPNVSGWLAAELVCSCDPADVPDYGIHVERVKASLGDANFFRYLNSDLAEDSGGGLPREAAQPEDLTDEEREKVRTDWVVFGLLRGSKSTKAFGMPPEELDRTLASIFQTALELEDFKLAKRVAGYYGSARGDRRWSQALLEHRRKLEEQGQGDQ